MKSVLFLHVLYLIFIKSFMVKGATKCGSRVEMRAVLLSCPTKDTGCEENDFLSQMMNAEQEQLVQANGRSFEALREKRTRGFPNAVKDCKRKLVITMKVKNTGRVPCEDKYIVVDHVYDPVTGGKGRLLSPVVVKLRQEQMVQLYGLQFQKVVNSNPYEEEISKGKLCSVSPDNPTCGIALYDGKPIPYSEGFCCSCSSHVNAKRQLSPVSNGDASIYRDSKLLSQGHSPFPREVEPKFINPELVQLRSKKAYDYSKEQEKSLKMLNSDKIPNYLLEKDRKIICDRGDFMNELCRLRDEKIAMNERDPERGKEQSLTERSQYEEKRQTAPGDLKLPTVMTQANVPISPNGRFTLKDTMEDGDTLNVEPKAMSVKEFKGSRGKRENRYEAEENTLEENLERFIKAKKLNRNRRKRLLEISHRRNQNKNARCSPNECEVAEFPEKDYVKPPPPLYFFSHDKIILNPIESTMSNASNKTPMQSAYEGLRYALEQNRFDTKWDKNARKGHQKFGEKQLNNHVSYEMNNNFPRENMKNHQYSLADKKGYGKDQRFKFRGETRKWDQEEQNQRGDQRQEMPNVYYRNKNDDASNMRNYFSSKAKGHMEDKRLPEIPSPGDEGKSVMKDYNEVPKEMKEENMRNVFEKESNMPEKMENYNEQKIVKEPQISMKGEYEPVGKYKYGERKFVQKPLEKYSSLSKSGKAVDQALDFNVEITHQNVPIATIPRSGFRNTDQSQYWKPKLNQWHVKQPDYLLFEQNHMNSPQSLYYMPQDLKKQYFHLNEPKWTPFEPEKTRSFSSYGRKQPNYFEPPSSYLKWSDMRPSPFQTKYDKYRMKDFRKRNQISQNFEDQAKNGKIRERRSVNEFEPAKNFSVPDNHSESNLAPNELNICTTESVKKPGEEKTIDITSEILSGLPKLKEKLSKMDKKKPQRSVKTNLDRLIQSYLNAPEYVLRQMEAIKEEPDLNESRNSSCNKSVEEKNTQETAHCMRFGDLWYSMYNIKKPVLAQIVGLQLFDKRTLNDGRTHWKDLTKGKMIRLGTFLSSAEDNLPSVSLTFTGEESEPLYSPIDPDNYVLLVPSHLSDPSKANFYPQLEGGPAEYLLVNRKDISSGGDCSKIGTSFEAFAHQPQRCHLPRGSCLKRQPVDLWREDMEARIRGKRGKYFVENFGTVPNSPIKTFTNLTGEYLAMEYYGDYSSTIEVELKADNNVIIRKGRSIAQIPTVFIDGTYPKKTKIYMSVLNTGLTMSSFRPRLGDCPPDLDPSFCPLEGPLVPIPPQKRHDFKLNLSGALPDNKLHAIVQVVNQDNQPVAQRKIRIKRGERCMCAFHCKCNCMGDPEEQKNCKRLTEEEYRAAGYLGPPPYRAGPLISKGFLANLRLVFVTASYVMIMFGTMKGILGAYFRSLGMAGIKIITGPRNLTRYYEPELQHCTVLKDEFGFPIHPTTCRPAQTVPLYCEFILNIFFFFLYPVRGFWLILKSSVCLKIVLGDCHSSRRDGESDCSPLLSQQNTSVNYNLTAITSKKCPADEYLPYLSYRGDNDPLEEDDTEFVLQEMEKHKKK